VNTCAFSPDWSKVVTGGDDHLVKLWDSKTGKVLFTLEDHKGAIKCVCFSNDGKCFASASYDHTVRVWDTVTGKKVFCLKGRGPLNRGLTVYDLGGGTSGHTHSVETCCFSPNSKYLCSGSWDNSAVVWSLKSGTPAYVLNKHRNVIQTCAFSADSKTVATGSWDCTVRIWSIDNDKVAVLCLKGHTSNVHATTFSSDDVLVSLNTVEFQCQGKFYRQIHGTAMGSPVSVVASASWDMTVRLWDSKSGDLLHVLEGHTGWVQSIVRRLMRASFLLGFLWHSAGDFRILYGGPTACGLHVYVRKPQGFRKSYIFAVALPQEAHQEDAHACSFNETGELLASASDDQTVRIWNTKTGECLRELECNTDEVHTCCFTPSGSLFASGPSEAETTICIY
ncbi:hypothetical protein QZH41_014405, partial [Actinostola sp. cb2023]